MYVSPTIDVKIPFGSISRENGTVLAASASFRGVKYRFEKLRLCSPSKVSMTVFGARRLLVIRRAKSAYPCAMPSAQFAKIGLPNPVIDTDCRRYLAFPLLRSLCKLNVLA